MATATHTTAPAFITADRIEEIDDAVDFDMAATPVDLTKVERSGKMRSFTARRNEAAFRAWIDAADIAA